MRAIRGEIRVSGSNLGGLIVSQDPFASVGALWRFWCSLVLHGGGSEGELEGADVLLAVGWASW